MQYKVPHACLTLEFEVSPTLDYKNPVNSKTSGKIAPDGNF